jgi:type III secretion system low calcium response chaperone LcrH/SycD
MQEQVLLQEAHTKIERSIDEVLTLIAESKKQEKLIPVLDTEKYKVQFRSEVESEVARCVDSFNQRFRLGASTIWNAFHQIDGGEASIHIALMELQEAVNFLKEDKTDLYLLQERVEKSETLKQVMGFSDKTMEAFYKIAYKKHELKDFESAANCFYFLCVLDPFVHSFWMGYGHSEQLLEHYTSALYAYAMATLIDLTDPTAHYFAAQCYHKLGNKSEALHSLDLALKCTKEDAHAKQVQVAASELINKLR